MLSLFLLRHAKSSWSERERCDHDRGLAPRGKRAAPRMGAYMAAQGLLPDRILCSRAVRARQTLELVLPELPGTLPIAYEEELYLATPAVLLARLRALGRGPERVMVVGHNPGLHSLALTLTGAGEPDELTALATKFPTAALAVIAFDVDGWDRIAPSSGRLTHFMTPKRLP